MMAVHHGESIRNTFYSRYVDPIMFNYVANLLKIFRKEVYTMAHVIT